MALIIKSPVSLSAPLPGTPRLPSGVPFHPDQLGIPYYTIDPEHCFQDVDGTVAPVDFEPVRRVNSRGVLGVDLIFNDDFPPVYFTIAGSAVLFFLSAASSATANNGAVVSYMSGQGVGSIFAVGSFPGSRIGFSGSDAASSRLGVGGSAEGTPRGLFQPEGSAQLSVAGGLPSETELRAAILSVDFTNRRRIFQFGDQVISDATYEAAGATSVVADGTFGIPANSPNCLVSAFGFARRVLSTGERADLADYFRVQLA